MNYKNTTSFGKPVPPTMSDLHNERVTAFTADKIESCFAFTTYLPRVSGKIRVPATGTHLGNSPEPIGINGWLLLEEKQH
jgi:hypothetical protein